MTNKKSILFLVISLSLLSFLLIFSYITYLGKNSQVRVALSSFPETFDAMTRAEYFTNLVNDEIYSTLFDVNGDKFYGLIGQSWQNLSDSLMVIHLKRDMYFHNGDPITATDVKASLERALTFPKSLIKNLVEVDSIKITDPYTLEIYHPNTLEIYRLLLSVKIYSYKHIQFSNEDFQKNQLICSGLYYLYSANDNLIVLKRNPYWKIKENDLFKEIKLYRIPDKDKQTNQLLNGELDFIINPPFERFSVIENRSDLLIIGKKSNVSMYMMMDIMNEKRPGMPQQRNPFKDKRVRQAIWHALDMQTFIKERLNNYGETLTYPWLNSISGVNSLLKPYKYDTQKSKELLKEAGYESGFPLKIYCVENKYNGDVELGEYVKTALYQIGIKAEVYFLPTEKFFDYIENNPVSCYIAGYSSTSDTPDGPLYSLTYKSIRVKGNLNRLNIEIPYLNNLIDSAKKLPNTDNAKFQINQIASQYMYDEALIIPLYAPTDNFALNRKVKWHPVNKEFKLSHLKRK
jgi:peptide/nickel transport system substrate-binding protein